MLSRVAFQALVCLCLEHLQAFCTSPQTTKERREWLGLADLGESAKEYSLCSIPFSLPAERQNLLFPLALGVSRVWAVGCWDYFNPSLACFFDHAGNYACSYIPICLCLAVNILKQLLPKQITIPS